MKRKAPEHRLSNQKYLSCQEKSCLGIKLIFFCAAWKLHPRPSKITLNFNLTYEITRADCDLLSFCKAKKQMILTKVFSRNNLLLPHLKTDRDLDDQLDVLRNSNLSFVSFFQDYEDYFIDKFKRLLNKKT